MNRTDRPVVVKLGGSLIEMPDLAERLQSVVRMLSSRKLLVVVGGGAAADEIRRLDRPNGMTAAKSHWAAIAAMTFNAHVVARTCGHLKVVADRIQADEAWKNSPAVLLDSETFLIAESVNQGRTLPESWSITSDSIAGFVAVHWPASELLFCKACSLVPTASAVGEDSDHTSDHSLKSLPSGALDQGFPNLMDDLQHASVRLSWVNLASIHSRPEPFLPPY